MSDLEKSSLLIKRTGMSESSTYPDFYYEPPEEMIRITSNPRYKFFRQNYWTAGDYEQFLERWDQQPDEDNFSVLDANVVADDPMWKGMLPWSKIRWEKYQLPCLHDVFRTYLYVSEKFKKGLFVRFSHGTLTTYLPFSKVNFINEWSDKIFLDRKKYSSVVDMMKHIAENEGRSFTESRVHKDVRCWYGNNGLVRLEFPISEGESGLNMIKDMLTCYTTEYHAPPLSFFINKRDFPLLTLNGTESYTSFFGKDTKLLSHEYPTYAPVLGMTTTRFHADIPIPTWEDWCRVSYWWDRRRFAKEFRTYALPEEFDAIAWSDKKETAVFRGASTGLGTTIKNNPRLFFSKESLKKKSDPEDGIPWFDAGITKWNLRPRKHPDSLYLETIEVSTLELPLATFLTPLDQARYKYILHLPGHSAAYRLSLELYYGSVILMHPCPYQLWFSSWLKPWVHYIPLKPFDVNDLIQKIKWCKTHDQRCQEIAQNARQFAEMYLSREGILRYLHAVFTSLVQENGSVIYNRQRLDVQLEKFLSKQLKLEQRVLVQRDNLPYNARELFATNPRDFFQVWTQYCPDWKSQVVMTLVTETRNTTISSFVWNDLSLILKKSRKQWKKNHCQEYAFYRFYGNLFAKEIPNFCSVLSYEEDQSSLSMVMDHVVGESMDHFLREPNTTLDDVIFLWMQLCLALDYAQEQCAFLHMDLFPWNVMLRRSAQAQRISYTFANHRCVHVETTCIPVLVDFEKSHFMVDGIHCYNTSPFRFCRIQDILSLVFSSLAIFIDHHTIHGSVLTTIFHIMNFFSSEYTQHHRFRSLSHVRMFLKRYRKFSNMVMDQKCGLEKVTILSFFDYLCPVLKKRPGRSLFMERKGGWKLVDPNFSFSVSSSETELESFLESLQNDETVSLAIKQKRLQRWWFDVEKRWTHSYDPAFKTPISELFCRIVRDRRLRHLQKKYEAFERQTSISVWQHLRYKDFLETKDFTHSVERLWRQFSPILIRLSKQSLILPCPDLVTHLCVRCDTRHYEKTNSTALTIQEARQLILMVQEFCPHVSFDELDFFTLWYQGFPEVFHRFLQQDCLLVEGKPESLFCDQTG